ncbi:MAG: hypothetical protein ABW123_11575, partial [Cystobacter sp.]
EELLPLLKPRKVTTSTGGSNGVKLSGPGTKGLGGYSSSSIGKRRVNDRSGFQALSDSLKKKEDAKKTTTGYAPVDIYHPTLALYRIRSVLFIKAGLLEPEGDGSKGVYTVRLEAIEYIAGSAAKGQVKKVTQSASILSVGPGKVARTLQQQQKPSDNNTGP